MHEVAVHDAIRRHVAAINGSKISWIEKHGGDVTVLSALLTAPAFLSGLTEIELATLKSKAESHLDPKVVEARTQTTKALKEVEAGWSNAIKKIVEKGGLTKNVSGAWSAPKVEAA